MKKAIVTGATGFIGSLFVEYLTQMGVEVLALGRKTPEEIRPLRRQKLSAAEYLQIDMRDILRLPEASASLGWETGDECVFFNLAWGGVTRLSDLNVQAQLSNVMSAVDALNAAYAIGCERFLHVGTMEEAFTYRYLELDHNKNSEYNRHVIYSVAKIAAKYALKLKASQLGIDFIYVLHSHVMAPDDDKDSFLQVTLGKLINGEELIFSTGEQLFDVVSASDCVRGYALICEKGLPGKEYWVGSGNPKPLREYVERMYNLYPSGIEMQFGKLPYNDVKLTEEDFSIAELENDTGYAPRLTYEDTVRELHDSLTRR
ncbi:NAD-dependent epimerase/dehydratase family protein [Mycobacterium sp. Aquia_213]|uniref:NAD-dependent epimerase/dehydratase family protein n=1 Tax=Mycobacterium sp. Aquia_213 TaxID=2991728 RepID=UPI00226EF5F2|nr:NAD(P)-dependent oxidoreductase [Mycobacterium sp. Aquia_213]WAC89467.1 NAD(P)-dependent oxidoreductase [Mycobacterium sp. Aquia_213]